MNKNSLKNRLILLAPFLIIFYISAIILSGGREVDPAELILEKREPETEVKCGFEGNSDAYGLGIRLGIYIQWFPSVLIFCFVHHDYHSLVAVSNYYQLAMLIALLVYDNQARTQSSSLQSLPDAHILRRWHFFESLYYDDQDLAPT